MNKELYTEFMKNCYSLKHPTKKNGQHIPAKIINGQKTWMNILQKTFGRPESTMSLSGKCKLKSQRGNHVAIHKNYWNLKIW